MDCGYFQTTRNGNHSSFMTPTVVGGLADAPFPLKSALTVTHPLRKTPTSTGHTLSQQPNDVMSEIEFAQLHSELFRRRHRIWQSHGLFALSKHLLTLFYF